MCCIKHLLCTEKSQINPISCEIPPFSCYKYSNPSNKMNRDLIYRYFRNETTQQEDMELHKWINADPANKEQFQRYDLTYAAMLMHSANIERKTPRWRTAKFWRMTAVQVAAIVALAVGVNYFFFSSPIPEKSYSIEVPAGERIKVTLEDGTVVWLNGGTRLMHPAIFAKDTRRVRIEGEAYFEVRRDEKRPFVVETFACDLKVLGTTFNVESREQENTLQAALLTGSLKACNFRDGESREVLMQPNDLLSYADGKYTMEKVSNPGIYHWQDEIINIQGLRFDEMMHLLEKVFGVRITIDRDKLPDMEFEGGKFRKSYGVENVLRTLQYGSKFSYDFDRENNVITIR